MNYPKIADSGRICIIVIFSMLTGLLITSLAWAEPIQWNVEIVDFDRSLGQYTSIALDSNNHPHISYYDTHNKDLKYAHFDGAQWNIETVDSEGKVGEYTSIAIDSEDHPHICYRDVENKEVRYARWDGTQWIIEQLSQEDAYVGSYISLALDSKDLPHVVYVWFNGPLRYAHFNGTHWTATSINPKLAAGSYTSIAIDSNDNPHIACRHRTAYKFFYVSWNGTHFVSTVPDGEGNVGQYSSIEVDAKDNPHISYFDYSNADLKYAWWSGTQWNVETVEETGNTGQHTSLELDEFGNPHIMYLDASKQDLRYAHWDGERWVFQTIDSEGTVGKFASFARDPEGHMYVSYHDGKRLKYASTRPDVIYPTADAGEDQWVNEGWNVQLDGSGSYDTVGIASWEWTLTDLEPFTFTGEKPQYRFHNPGIFTVTLTVADPTGNSDTDEVVITVKDITKPVANAGEDQTVGPGMLVTFDGSESTDNVGIVSYTWTFQDIAPQTLTGLSPTYTFTRTGRYTVTLTAEDAAGNFHRDHVVIKVEDITDTTKPVAIAGDDQTVDEGTTVSFDGSKSYDDYGIVSYTWTFDDVSPQTLNGDKPTYPFDRPGRFVVTLTVEDAAGNSHSDDVVITVTDTQEPVAKGGGDQTVDDGTHTFDGSGSVDSGGIESFEWTFTDNGVPQVLTGEMPTYDFTRPGVYEITLKVTDGAGKTSTQTFTITVEDKTPPEAEAGEDRSAEPGTVTLDGSQSTDNGDIVSYEWTFTDNGQTQTLTGETVTYDFNNPGTYIINLRVTDGAGNSQTDTFTLTVQEGTGPGPGPGPGDDTEHPEADAGRDKKVRVDKKVNFDGGGSTDNVGIVSYDWDFGDGSTGTGKGTSHTFTEEGTYTVTLTVEDAAGNEDTDTVRIEVVKSTGISLPLILGLMVAALAIPLILFMLTRKKKHECQICKLKFDTEEGLREHHQKEHKKPERPDEEEKSGEEGEAP